MEKPSLVYTVTLNPVIDRIYQVDEFEKGTTFRCDSMEIFPAGKGLSVSYALSSMGVQSEAYLPVGYEDLAVYQRFCEQHKVQLHPFTDDFHVRSHCTILETVSSRVTHIQTHGVNIEEECIRVLTEDLVNHLRLDDLVILSGSLPPNLPSDCYAKIIEKCKRKGARVCLDTSGEPLRHGVPAHPFVLKINQQEAEELTSHPIRTPQDVYTVLQAIRQISTIPVLAVSLGAEGLIGGCDEGIWRMKIDLEPERVKDTVGSGDSLMAGMVYGLLQKMECKEMFRYALAAATAAVMQLGLRLLNPDWIQEMWIWFKLSTGSSDIPS